MTTLLLLGAMLATFSAVAAAAAWACVRASAYLPARFARSSRARAALAVMPVVIASSVALSLTSPLSLLAGCHCISHPHHVHLCFDHTAFSWPLGYLALLGGAGAIWQLGRAFVVLRAAVETGRWASSLTSEATEGIQIVPALGARAVTVGLFRPRAFFGSALWARLDSDGKRAVVAHELAHVARRDVLTLLCLRLAACAMPTAIGAHLVESWRRAAEIACDRIAADALGDPCVLADALVACGKLQLAASPAVLPAAALSLVDGDDLETRVTCLLERPASGAPACVASGDLSSVTAVALALGILIASAGGSAAHHAFETVLGWVS